ncbi:DUF305 domain-containing protein [Deinococcus oregonensis]|uniref:DUF305 domain-containing protein n=1 Tax=Deinococcus oregonensis TaxID=1805970 RepID=A0ABV6AZ66_9DEIO
MNTLLKSYGGPDAAMAASMTKSMAGMGEMVQKAKNLDVAFVQGMLPHHASAIEMASIALQQATKPHSPCPLARHHDRAGQRDVQLPGLADQAQPVTALEHADGRLQQSITSLVACRPLQQRSRSETVPLGSGICLPQPDHRVSCACHREPTSSPPGTYACF